MDLSKLPKLSQSPPPAVQRDPVNADPAQSRPMPAAPAYNTPSANAWDLGFELLMALILGVFFLTIGMRFGSWSIAKLSGRPFNTGVTWGPAGEAAGKAWDEPVDYFDLQYGTAWNEMGYFVLGIALLLAAAVLALAMWRRRAGGGTFGICMTLALIGTAANLVALVMVMQAGITMPIITLVALLTAVLMTAVYARHLFDRPAATTAG